LGNKHIFSLFKRYVAITPTPARRELGNMLIVGPTRSGKGLLATSQLLSWEHSVIVNDIKGELFNQTAGYRAKLGPVYVIDPGGVGHRFNPLAGKTTEDELLSSAARLLYHADEGAGAIFTQRATVMLTQIFLAALAQQQPALPYARQVIREGLNGAAARLNAINPQLSTQFLDAVYEEADLSDRFLLSSWGTLSARLRPLLTETVIRCFAGSDFTPDELIQGEKPVTLYLRWPERDILALSPLVRLLWGALIDELVTIYDRASGSGCRPVMLLVDEAGRAAIPSLADHATTVVGRNINIWLAIQSLSQLEAIYGKPRAQVIRDNMETQLYYRPTDLATAAYLEDRLGHHSGYARTTTEREGKETSEAHAERPVPLLSAQEILQMEDAAIIGFHRHLPPFRLARMDWRKDAVLRARHNMPAPQLPTLPVVAAEAPGRTAHKPPNGYVDPDGGI
jgi:type IV secretion system protein VirD4